MISSKKLREGGYEKAVPEVYALRNCVEFNSWHDETTFEHTCNVLEEFETLAHKYSKRPRWRSIESNVSVAILLHDVGKLDTREVADGGKTSFPGHEERGYEISQEIMSRMLYSKEDETQILNLVRNHGDVHKRIVTNFFDFSLDMLVLGYVDTLSSKLEQTKPEDFKARFYTYTARIQHELYGVSGH